MADYARRFAAARGLADHEGLAGLYVAAGPNFRWLTGEVPHPGGWPLWLSGVVVPVDGEPSMVISKMHAEIFDIDASPISRVFTYVDGEDPAPALRSAFRAAGLEGGGALGVEDSLWFGDVDVLSSTFPDLRLRRASGVFERLRTVKDAEEIEQLRLAAAAHDAGYERAREAIHAGTTVAEAGAEIVRAMLEAGSEDLAIVGTFKNLSDRRFEPGDIVDVDLWPGSHGGYHADSARNVFVGEPRPEAARLYEVTRRAYDAAVAATRPGVPAEAVHRACAEAMAEGGFEQVWKVGHGVGLAEIHEPPLLQPGNTDELEAGMVFTIDPGAFIARDTPIHIEDTVVVTQSGCESLNRFPHEPIIVS
jgi:Xaa-Pro aminopeptidase